MPKKYDDASWHYGGDFPKDLPTDAGATHIGMFLAWAVLAGMGSDFLLREMASAEVQRLQKREITPGRFLIEACDEKLVDDELTDDGNAFAAAYYLSPLHLEDYEDVLGSDSKSLYHLPDTWESFDRLKPIFDKRLQEWKTGRLKATKRT